MKKILIVSHLFAPQNSIGALRPTKIAKYLTKKNYKVDVVTIDFELKDSFLLNDLQGINKTFFVRDPNKNSYKNVRNKGNNKSNNSNSELNNSSNVRIRMESFKTKIKKSLMYFKAYLKMFISSVDFFKSFRNIVLKKEVLLDEYEVVFTTFGPLSSVLCGLWIKKRNPNIKWICDFRDPMVVEFTPKLFKVIYNYIQVNACKNADYIIAVSEGYLQRICMGKFKWKSKTIPNGFDIEDFSKISKGKKVNKFSFVYVGSLYGGKRKIDSLFEVLSILKNEGKVDLNDIEFSYAGTEFSELHEQAKKYKVEKILVDYGSLSRKDCLDLQYRSHFLVLSTWNNSGEEGVLPGKLLEYMLFNKPIIALISGNKKNSEVYNVVSNTRLGIAVEEIQEEHFNKLQEYLLTEYQRYKKGIEPLFNPDKHLVKQFNYENITDQIISIIENRNSIKEISYEKNITQYYS